MTSVPSVFNSIQKYSFAIHSQDKLKTKFEKICFIHKHALTHYKNLMTAAELFFWQVKIKTKALFWTQAQKSSSDTSPNLSNSQNDFVATSALPFSCCLFATVSPSSWSSSPAALPSSVPSKASFSVRALVSASLVMPSSTGDPGWCLRRCFTT